jgi:hypothetical protein
MILFRQTDSRYPFLWEDEQQPPGRWHGEGEGPVHYLADTPDGAWAELIRHEEIRDAEELKTIRRSLWAVEVPEDAAAEPRLPVRVLTGDPDTWSRCRQEARRLREAGAAAITCPSAALLPGHARGFRVRGGLKPGPPRDGRVHVLFGRRPDLVGWLAVAAGGPREELLARVRHFGGSPR